MGLHNSQFIPANCKIGYSIETLRGRLARACECLGHTLGVLPPQQCSEHHLRFTFVLEEGALTIPEMWKLHSSLSAWDDLTLVAHLHYTPAKQQGCFVVAGVVNHLLCDRRVIQCIFGLAEPMVEAPPSMLRDLCASYGPCASLDAKGTVTDIPAGKRLFYKRIMGDLREWAENTLQVEETETSLLPKLLTALDKRSLYQLFYEQVGRRLSGQYLLFIVKDTYLSEHKRTGDYHMHSRYGYFVRSVSFPCSLDSFVTQVKDTSASPSELFSRAYRGTWTLNDQSEYENVVPGTLWLTNDELSTIDMLRFLNLSFRYGPFAAGSCFQVINMGVTGKVDVLVVTNYKPMQHWALATAAAVVACAAVMLLHRS